MVNSRSLRGPFSVNIVESIRHSCCCAALLIVGIMKLRKVAIISYHLQKCMKQWLHHSLLFTKNSGKSGWKVNGRRLLRSFWRKIAGSNVTSETVVLSLVAQTLDSDIHRINHYPADKY